MNGALHSNRIPLSVCFHFIYEITGRCLSGVPIVLVRTFPLRRFNSYDFNSRAPPCACLRNMAHMIGNKNKLPGSSKKKKKKKHWRKMDKFGGTVSGTLFRCWQALGVWRWGRGEGYRQLLKRLLNWRKALLLRSHFFVIFIVSRRYFSPLRDIHSFGRDVYILLGGLLLLLWLFLLPFSFFHLPRLLTGAFESAGFGQIFRFALGSSARSSPSMASDDGPTSSSLT